MDDTTLLAIIRDAVNNYTEPCYRKIRKSDFETNSDIDYSYLPYRNNMDVNQHQKEYGERKRIKP
jgi:hypothetical protein